MTTEEADIVKANMGLVYEIAGQFYGAEREDLIQAGSLGIVKAYRKYKKNENTKFSTYAFSWILGEMHELASQKQIKISRDVLRLYKLIEKTRYSLAQRLNRVPTNEELATYLEKDVTVIEQAIQAGSAIVSSLDKGEYDDRSIYETIPSEEKLLIEDRLAINESLESLGSEEQQIIKYRYFDDLTQSEIAKKLNMTQVMVSRYEKKGIDKMREYYIQN